MISSSQLLEDFLDFHGAKNNTDWYFFRELTAAVRHLSLATYSQKHILNRLIFYDLVDMENFTKEGESTFEFLACSLKKLVPVIIDEARRLRIPVPKGSINTADFPEVVKIRALADIWDRMDEHLRSAIELDPLIISNGTEDGWLMPTHLTTLGFYILRARSNLVEIRSVLDR